uniref:FAR1 domain-containing protein n=1 Tax=Schistocephalus solidus TaxID=70667 RepID=A0A0X3PVY5_SCHSO
MSAPNSLLLKFNEYLYGHDFHSLFDLEMAVKKFSQDTGYYYKPRSSHKYPDESKYAEKFVYASRKYACILAPVKGRVGCDSFFNVVHRRRGERIIVTSFKLEHNHDLLSTEHYNLTEVPLEYKLKGFSAPSPSPTGGWLSDSSGRSRFSTNAGRISTPAV